MAERTWALSEDMGTPLVVVVLALLLVWLGFLGWELRTRERFGFLIAATGFIAALLVGATVLRPATGAGRAAVHPADRDKEQSCALHGGGWLSPEAGAGATAGAASLAPRSRPSSSACRAE